jgi:hypothetical protein
VRYTFPQTLEDFKAARSLIISRQRWARPLIIALAVLGVVVASYPWLNGHPPSLRWFILSTVPYLMIIMVWIALLAGFTRSAMIVLGVFVLLNLYALVGMGRPAPVGTVLEYTLPYAFFFGVLAMLPYVTTRLFRSSPLLRGDVTVELLPEELRVVREASTSTFRWGSIVRAAETRDYFLIFMLSVRAQYIPKRVIPPGELDALRTFLRSHVPSGLL